MVFLFPGQGSQSPGMGKWLYDQFPKAKTVFEEVSDAISVDIRKLCFDESEATLALTANTQPAILTVSIATLQMLRSEFDLNPKLCAGHSVGEYAALVAAKVFSLSTAAKAVRLRGQAMQEATPAGTGGMAAILGLSLNQVQSVCREVQKQKPKEKLEAANDNCPGQIVVSGTKGGLDALKELDFSVVLQGSRLKVIPLQVSAPFHSSLMKPAEEKMRAFFKETTFAQASVPVVQNKTAAPETRPEFLKENLIQQVTAPVLWTQSMQWMKENGQSQMLECGSGKVLSGLLKKIDGAFFQVLNFNALQDLDQLKNRSM